MAAEELPGRTDEKEQKDYAKKKAQELAKGISGSADTFISDLNNMSEEEVAKLDISAASKNIKTFIDGEISARPYIAPTDLLKSTFEEAQNIIINARADAFYKIDNVVEEVKAKKETIVSALQKIDEGKELYAYSEETIDNDSDAASKILGLVNPSMAQINAAKDQIAELKNHHIHCQNAADRVSDIANELREPPYSELALAQREAPNFLEMYKSMANRNKNYTTLLEGADDLVKAFLLESKANYEKDGKQFDDAKKAQNAARMKVGPRNESLSEDEKEPTV